MAHAKIKKKDDDEMEDFHAEDAARELLRAEEIKQDKKLYNKALKKLKKKKNAINSIDDLRKKANELD